jgi:hypothetical protein
MLGGAFGSGGVTTMECLIAAGVEEAIECAHELMLFLQYVTHVAEIQSRSSYISRKPAWRDEVNPVARRWPILCYLFEQAAGSFPSPARRLSSHVYAPIAGAMSSQISRERTRCP